MTRPDLDALAALLARATPGPWELSDETDGRDTEPSIWHVNAADAALIVAAVNALPALIARVRELERERVHSIASARRDAEHAAAIAMRERCAQHCERVPGSACAIYCAAAIRALEP